MNDPAHIGIRDLRDDISRRVEAAHFQDEPTIITKNGKPRAVLVPYAWYVQQTES